MKTFSRLCPQCQKPLISNEMYCSRCNTYSPEARPNTTSGFLPPHPQYPDLSGQNWTQSGLMPGFSGGKVVDPQQSRSVSKRPNRPLLVGGILGVCLLLTVSFLFGKNLGMNESPSTTATHPISAATSTQVTPTQATLTQATPTSVGPTSLPAAALSSPRLPLNISCVNCPYPQLMVTLNRIETDSADRSTRWVFSLVNSGSDSCSSFDFFTIRLIDAIGTDYRGEGQVASYFAMSAGQSLQQIALFAVLPTAGTQYTLKLQIYISGCAHTALGYQNTYQTENFTFA